ncbi:MAG: hypothetical protein RMJ53_03350, partial [Chitinophagales bacterium]|nr:hypothetical protein [Chitinophagales bacterium]
CRSALAPSASLTQKLSRLFSAKRTLRNILQYVDIYPNKKQSYSAHTHFKKGLTMTHKPFNENHIVEN